MSNRFVVTTFLLSIFNVQARGITTSNVILGMAHGYEGLVQLIDGIQSGLAVTPSTSVLLDGFG